MIPYFDAPPLAIGAVTLHWPMLLWALGLAIHYAVFLWWLRDQKVADPKTGAELYAAILVPALTGGWLLGLSRAEHRGLQITDALLAGLAGAIVYIVVRRLTMPMLLSYWDAMAFAWPAGGLLMRAGCVLEHAHLGNVTSTENPFGVQTPEGPRWDVAVLEILFAIVVAPAMFWSPRKSGKPVPWRGPFLFLAYGCLRIVTGNLRTADPGFTAGFSPASVMIPIGVVLTIALFLTTRKDQAA